MPARRGKILYLLLATYGAVVAAGVVFVGLPLHLALRRDYVGRATESFNDEVRQWETEIAAAARRRDRARLDELAARLNAHFQGRVTLLGPQGEVLGDSIGFLCAQRAGPECAEKIRAGAAEPPAAIPDTITLTAFLRLSGVGPATARLALPLAPVYEQTRRVRTLLAVGAVGAGLLALLVALALARYLARPLQHMTEVAERIAAGDLDTPARVRTGDEIGRLGEAINRMRGQLRAQITALAAERNQVLAIVQNMSEGVLAFGPSATSGDKSSDEVLLFNAAAERLLHLEGRLRTGTRLDQLGLDPRLLAAIRQMRETGRPVTLELGDLAGGERVIAVSIGPVGPAPEGGRPPGGVLIAHDITEARRIEALGRELVANASHELRTPLATISSTVETLLEGPSGRDSRTREFLEIIARQVGRLRELVESTLALSRVEALAGHLKVEAVDAGELLREAAATYEAEMARKEQQLVLEVPSDIPPLTGDGPLLLQALRHLVSNAVRYTPTGGRITLRATQEAGRSILEVSDTGPGIPAAEHERIFEPFYRSQQQAAGTGANASEAGVGLGLAIVRRIVRAHSGSISVRSAPGQGATFTLRLPVVSGPRA